MWTKVSERLWRRADGAEVVQPEARAGYPMSGRHWFASEPGNPMNRIRTAYLTPESAMHDADETWPKEAQFYNPLAQRYVPLQIGAINPTSGAIKLLGPDVHNHSGQSLLGDEGTITWHVKVGERFEKGALLAEIKTLAGVHEIRAKAGGSISTILIQEGAVVDRSFVPLAELER